jgi:hypothetical protein
MFCTECARALQIFCKLARMIQLLALNFVLICWRRDVSWWLSFSATKPPTNSKAIQLIRSSNSRVSNRGQVAESTTFQDEVANLNREIDDLLKLKNYAEVIALHLKTCCVALDQCFQVHYDGHLGHSQFWEYLDCFSFAKVSNDSSDRDRSRKINYICRQYLEKVSNMLQLAGLENPKSSPPIKHPAFRDQIMQRFKGDDPVFEGIPISNLSANWTEESHVILIKILKNGLVKSAQGLFEESSAQPPIHPNIFHLMKDNRSSFPTLSACKCSIQPSFCSWHKALQHLFHATASQL